MRVKRAARMALPIAVALAAPLGYGGEQASNERTIPLASPADLMAVVDAKIIAFVSNRDRRLTIVDVDATTPPLEIRFASLAESLDVDGFAFTDIVAVSEAGRVYLVGTLPQRNAPTGSQVVVARVDLRHTTSSVTFLDSDLVVRAPSIAVTPDERVILGDEESAALSVFREFPFERRQVGLGELQSARQELYLKSGPVRDIEISRDGRFVVASHAYVPSISLIDLASNSMVDGYGSSEGSGPLAICLAGTAEPTIGLVIASKEGSYLALAEVNEYFQALNQSARAALGFKPALRDRRGLALLLSGSRDLGTILVADRDDLTAELFRRISSDGTLLRVQTPIGRAGGLERANIVRLSSPPGSVGVSPDGQLAAILLESGTAVMVVKQPLEWWGGRGFIPGSESIREAQRILAMLGYPIGTVDGLDGTRTREALLAFKEAAKLNRNGELDAATMDALRQVAAELPSSGADLLSAGSGTSSCAPRPEDERCSTAPGALLRKALGRSELPMEEVLCARAGGRVQADRWASVEARRTYLCSAVHSCAFIRYRSVAGYESLCR